MGVYSRLPEKTSGLFGGGVSDGNTDRKSTRLNSSHSQISYAVFCLKKKNWTLRLGICTEMYADTLDLIVVGDMLLPSPRQPARLQGLAGSLSVRRMRILHPIAAALS